MFAILSSQLAFSAASTLAKKSFEFGITSSLRGLCVCRWLVCSSCCALRLAVCAASPSTSWACVAALDACLPLGQDGTPTVDVVPLYGTRAGCCRSDVIRDRFQHSKALQDTQGELELKVGAGRLVCSCGCAVPQTVRGRCRTRKGSRS